MANTLGCFTSTWNLREAHELHVMQSCQGKLRRVWINCQWQPSSLISVIRKMLVKVKSNQYDCSHSCCTLSFFCMKQKYLKHKTKQLCGVFTQGDTRNWKRTRLPQTNKLGWLRSIVLCPWLEISHCQNLKLICSDELSLVWNFADMSQEVWKRLCKLSVKFCGEQWMTFCEFHADYLISTVTCTYWSLMFISGHNTATDMTNSEPCTSSLKLFMVRMHWSLFLFYQTSITLQTKSLLFNLKLNKTDTRLSTLLLSQYDLMAFFSMLKHCIVKSPSKIQHYKNDIYRPPSVLIY